MAGKGTIYTYTVIHSAAEDFKNKVPYVVAVVEEDGRRFAARVEGYEPSKPISIGMEVEHSGEDPKGRPIYKFIH
ncbi:MAG TPA: OB-fold domain-containing protein [Syntrophales bacterium]|nr:OB-fold domain-containing protein [Syntrophales bacterium]